MSHDYFGSNLDLDSLEILTVQNIDAKLLKLEPALYERKWFDYRALHPAAATYLMVHHYNRAYGDFIGRALDHRKRFMTAFKGDDFFPIHERKSFWRLRQKIDELGIRYEFFLREAMNWYIDRGWGKQAPNPPRPQHISTNDELIVDVCNAWEMEKRGRIQFAQSPRYQVEQWVSSPDQLAYESYLIDAIKRRPVKQYALHSALYQFGHLRIEAALENFTSDDVSDAIEICLQG